MKNVFLWLAIFLCATACNNKKEETIVNMPLVGRWQKARQVGSITKLGKTTSTTKNISSQGAYYEFRDDGSYTEQAFDSTAVNNPLTINTGKYSVSGDQLKLITDNSQGAGITYLEYIVGDSQLYLTDSKQLRLKAIDEQAKINPEVAKAGTTKLVGIDDFETLFTLQKQ